MYILDACKFILQTGVFFFSSMMSIMLVGGRYVLLTVLSVRVELTCPFWFAPQLQEGVSVAMPGGCAAHLDYRGVDMNDWVCVALAVHVGELAAINCLAVDRSNISSPK